MARVITRRVMAWAVLLCLFFQVAAYGPDWLGAAVAGLVNPPGPTVTMVLAGPASRGGPPGPGGTSRQAYIALARQDAAAVGIPPDLFVRQINQESGFDPRCGQSGDASCTSGAGAEGIAQFMPTTAAGLGIDPWDPVQALWGAAQLMSRYDRIYGDYRKALAAYNGGTGALHDALQVCGANWLSCEPAETQRYVAVIMDG